jgi:hypothetical protein
VLFFYGIPFKEEKIKTKYLSTLAFFFDLRYNGNWSKVFKNCKLLTEYLKGIYKISRR